jgi:hypothetical protein
MRRFVFEADIYETPSCVPMAVREKLDCVAIKISLHQWLSFDLSERLEGFFAHLNIAGNSLLPELHLLLDDPDGVLHSIAVLLSVPTLEEACRVASTHHANYEEKVCWSAGAAQKISDEQLTVTDPRAVAANLSPLISLLLYLCSQTVDYRDSTGRRKTPGRPLPVQTRKGPRIFPPNEPTIWETGYRMGAPLRHALSGASGREGSDRSSPTPHIRRAHWHSFWHGPRIDAVNVGSSCDGYRQSPSPFQRSRNWSGDPACQLIRQVS